ncbi:MAG: CoA-binding protein [Deltaproteobacteria bacterium]|nr:CoA-binding protein [Deltaproteobacteria bacterium]
MDFFFNPRGIAVLGATPNEQKGGFSILKNLLSGFSGNIYPVNPRYTEISGLRCFPAMDQVPDPVDLAIIFVPAAITPQAVDACAKRGLPGVIIQCAGFSETGKDGAVLQDQLIEVSRRTGIRIWGPNCMGMVDAVHKRVFSFVTPTIWDEGLLPGNISLIVQSGMLSAGFLIDMMTRDKRGVSKVCSIGNKVDVDECHILEYLLKDPDTAVIGLYLESIKDGRRFFEICGNAGKPVVVLKGGKSESGARAAMSHTASMAGNSAIIKGAMTQAGVVQANDFRQMMDFSATLALFPNHQRHKPGRIAIATFSGGAGIVSSDFLDRHNLLLAKLSQGTLKSLRTVFPEWMPPANPIDLWPAVERSGVDTAYGRTIEALCADPGVDAVFMHAFVGGLIWHLKLAPIVEMVRKANKPIFLWLIGSEKNTRRFEEEARALKVPVFRELSRAVECMGAVFS